MMLANLLAGFLVSIRFTKYQMYSSNSIARHLAWLGGCLMEADKAMAEIELSEVCQTTGRGGTDVLIYRL